MLYRFLSKYFLLLIATAVSVSAFSQTAITIRGRVVEDGENATFIPYADVRVKGDAKGIFASDSGYFSINITKFPATLIVSSPGYDTKEVTVFRIRRNITVELKWRINQLEDVIVHPSENPAHTILRKMVKNKKSNNPDNIKSYTQSTYRRNLWQLKNLDSSLVESNAVFRSLKKSMVEQQDSVKRYTIPLLFAEEVNTDVYNLSPYYSYSVPELERKRGMSVLDDASIFEDYTSMFSERVNFYGDNILLNNTPIVNPISMSALAFYNLRLIPPDTIRDPETGLRLFHIRFSPKNKRDAVFEGDMIVYDSIFAIKTISAKLLPTSNVPFIIGYKVNVDYMLIPDNSAPRGYRPYVERSTLDIDFHFLKFKDDKVRACANIAISNHHSNVVLNPPLQQIVEDEEKMFVAKKVSEKEMVAQRKDSLSVVEQNAMTAMTELNKIGWVRFANQAAIVLGSGYYNVGQIDIGPYGEIFKLNGAEGVRINAPLRTSSSFHPNFFADGMLGYGCKDMKFKAVLDMGWKFNTRLREVIKVGGEYNSFRVGGNEAHYALLKENAMVTSEDLLWFSLFSVKLDDKYTTRYGGYIGFEREWNRWLMSNISFSSYNIESSPYTPLTHQQSPVDVLNQQELSLRLRISSNTEKRSDFFARRVYLSNGYLPIINPVLTLGSYDLHGANKHGYYAKLHVAVKQQVPIGITKLWYALEAGTILGAVPFPLLEGHRSIESFMYASYKFNLLYNLTLASDNYLSLMMEYNLNGLILNRIPLIRELNLKEMLNCKILYNFLDVDKHNQVLDMPDYLYARNSSMPYMEVGAGVQNIFQVLGIGCVWRVPMGDATGVPYAYTNFSVVARFSPGR